MAEPFGVKVQLKPKINASDLASAVKKAAATKTASGAFTIPSVTIKKIDAGDAIKELRAEIERELGHLSLDNIGSNGGRNRGGNGGGNGGRSGGNRSEGEEISIDNTRLLRQAQSIYTGLANAVAKYQTNLGSFDTHAINNYEASVISLGESLENLRTTARDGTDISDLYESFVESARGANELKKGIDSGIKSVEAAENQLQSLRGMLDTIKQDSVSGSGFDTAELESQINGLSNALDTVKQRAHEGGETAAQAYTTLADKIRESSRYAEQLSTKLTTVKQVNDAILQMQNYLKQHGDLSDDNVNAINGYIAALQKMKSEQKFDPNFFKQQIEGFSNIKVAAQQAGEASKKVAKQEKSQDNGRQSPTSELRAAQKVNDRIARDALKIQTDNGTFKTDSLIAYEEKLKEVRAAFNALVEAQKQGGDSGALASSFSTAVKEADALKDKIQEEAKEISNVQALIDSLSKKGADLRSAGRIGDADTLDGYVNNLKTAQQAIIENKSYTQEQYQALIQAAEAARRYSESLGSSAVSVKTVNDKILEMQRYMQQNTNLSDKTRQEIESIIAALQEMSRSGKVDPGQFKLLIQQFSQLKVAAYEAGETGSNAMQRIGQVIKRFATNKLSTQMFTYIRQLCREMASAVKDVDSAMTQLGIVTGASGSQMVKFFNEASVAAKNLGASVSDVLDSIQVFSRLGYNLNDSLELSSAATVLSNVAATSVDEATTGLTSIIKGFGIEASDAMSVADILTEVGQKYAVSAEELMEALERGGSSLQAANNSLEEAVALVAAGNASVQDASSVGGQQCADNKDGYIG